VGEGRFEIGVLDLIDERGEPLDERDARAEEDGELPRGHRHVEGGDALEDLGEIDVLGALPLGLGALEDLRDHHAFALEDVPEAAGAVAVAPALHGLPGAVHALLGVDLHAPQPSSPACVAARTSAMLVMPAMTWRAPRSRRRRMPCSRATFWMALASLP